MKSIKPGRGPSAMGAVGSIVAIVFGIFWTFSAAKMGAPIFFPFFGIIFIGIGAMQFFYNYKNATGKNRMSLYDITDEGEEADPIQDILLKNNTHDSQSDSSINNTDKDDMNFCPYCGKALDDEYEFCPKCGKKLRK